MLSTAVVFCSAFLSVTAAVLCGLKIWQTICLTLIGILNLFFIKFCIDIYLKGLERIEALAMEQIEGSLQELELMKIQNAEDQKLLAEHGIALNQNIEDFNKLQNFIRILLENNPTGLSLVDYAEFLGFSNKITADEVENVEEVWSDVVEVPEDYNWRKIQ